MTNISSVAILLLLTISSAKAFDVVGSLLVSSSLSITANTTATFEFTGGAKLVITGTADANVSFVDKKHVFLCLSRLLFCMQNLIAADTCLHINAVCTPPGAIAARARGYGSHLREIHANYPSFSALRFFPFMLCFQHATAHACTRLACIIALCLFDACEPDMCSSIIMWSGSLLAGIAISITTKNPCETGGKNKKQSFPLCVHQSVNTLCFLRRRSHISHAPATHTTPRANLQPKSRQYPA